MMGLEQAVIAWQAPAQVRPSSDYIVTVDGRPVFVYQTPVRAEILKNGGLWTHKPDYGSQTASFVIFDMTRPVTVKVRPSRPVKTAVLLPERAGIAARVVDGEVVFKLDKPRKLSLLCDGDDSQVLHLFAGAPETDVPGPKDADVRYFGPGYHEVEPMHIRSGQTVYVAGGAYLKVKVKAGDAPVYSEKWKVGFLNGAVFDFEGAENARLCGRGVVDVGDVPHPGYSTVSMKGSGHIRVEGVTLCNAANWNFVMGTSTNLRVRDVRIISARLNSDGINTVNSRDVRIRDCFVRNSDDSIVVKTTQPDAPARDVAVEDCVVWNDWGYALGVTYETRSPVSGILFRNNDIVYAANWCLGLHLSDSATVSDVRFENTSVSAGPVNARKTDRPTLSAGRMLMKFVIARDVWGHDPERGRIRNVAVDGVSIYGTNVPPSEMAGADAGHDISGVTVQGVSLGGEPLDTVEKLRITTNAFVNGLKVRR
jgi:hypothetical protein